MTRPLIWSDIHIPLVCLLHCKSSGVIFLNPFIHLCFVCVCAVCVGRGFWSRKPAAMWLHSVWRDSSSYHQHQTVHHMVRRENEENQCDHKVRTDSKGSKPLWRPDSSYVYKLVVRRIHYGSDREVKMLCCYFSRTGASSFRACFSFHSSYSEVLRFLFKLLKQSYTTG